MTTNTPSDSPPTAGPGNTFVLAISWLWVGIPLVWGVLETLATSAALFR